MDEASEIALEGFHGVYLLYSKNPEYLGRTYIGYTVNPNRRIDQHNKGVLHGGAVKTSHHGPWEMALVVHGFPSSAAALRFEWAWQNPHRSRHLRITFKKTPRRSFASCLTVAWTMLRMAPWRRLPLVIRWLSADLFTDFPAGLAPPVHMAVAHGPLTLTRSPNPSDEAASLLIHANCAICSVLTDVTDVIICVSPLCDAQFHITCLGLHFLMNDSSSSDEMFPVEGNCPSCNINLLWGELVGKRYGDLDPFKSG